MKGINNLAKKYFQAQFQIVPNFHYKVRACRSQKQLAFVDENWRNTSFDERNK